MFDKDKVISLLNKKGWSKYRLAKEANIPQSSLHDILSEKIKNPTGERLKAIADALSVSVNDFFDDKNNIETENNKLQLNKRDLRDISKDIDSIMKKLNAGEDGQAYYNDIEMEEEDKELFRSALELALKTIKIKNKETYTPKKYKK